MSEQNTKAGVSVAEMARMVGLSRARFYQLIGSAFPCPIYNVLTRRPFYTAELQTVCLEVRRRNCGIDNKPVLFYARRLEIRPVAVKRCRKKPAAANNQHADLLDGLRSLGLADVTTSQVEQTVKRLYPCGVKQIDEGEVLRAVFLAIKRQDSPDNLTR